LAFHTLMAAFFTSFGHGLLECFWTEGIVEYDKKIALLLYIVC
jgi:hypothetical protein